MGKAYSPEQRELVRSLLEAGRDEEAIEKETGVSDRTIRRWKLELERTGRIGKPPEARTGRHRVLSHEIEQALIGHVQQNPDLSVDDMLWWLYERYKIVVGTRTIRRVFERKGDKVKIKGSKKKSSAADEDDEDEDDAQNDGKQSTSQMQTNGQYQSPYAPMAQQTAASAEQHLAQALSQQNQHTSHQQMPQFQVPPLPGVDDNDADEETLQLQLKRIALEKQEVELKLKLKRIQSGNNTPQSGRKASTPGSSTSTLYNPNLVVPTPPKRDSRSKKKIEESKRRTAERQERMLRDLERRSRRRDHLTAEWVQSKDIWPLRAQGLLADLMHQYSYYGFTQSNVETFEAIYRELYQLVDLAKGDWVPQVHDEQLRERMKRKMGQLRTKMQKTGEIITRTDGYGGFQKADNYTGEQAGAAEGDENEIVTDLPTDHNAYPQSGQTGYDQSAVQNDYSQQMQGGAHEPQMQEQLQFDQSMPDHSQMQMHNMQQYANHMGMGIQGPPQYPGMHMEQIAPYTMNVNGAQMGM